MRLLPGDTVTFIMKVIVPMTMSKGIEAVAYVFQPVFRIVDLMGPPTADTFIMPNETNWACPPFGQMSIGPNDTYHSQFLHVPTVVYDTR